MPGRDTKYAALAREADERIKGDRALQEQLSMLPDEASDEPIVQDGRKSRGEGKALSQMREFLAAQGYRFPEEVLAQIAGLDRSQGDTLEAAMVQAERILAWAQRGAAKVPLKGGKTKEAEPTLGQRLAVFQGVRAAQLRAADALMPYGAPKATPDGPQQTVVPVLVPQAPSTIAPRDVTPTNVAPLHHEMAPANVVWERQQKQEVSSADTAYAEDEARTE